MQPDPARDLLPGGVHTSAERRARWGDAVAPGFVRLSVGCEPVEELWGLWRRRWGDWGQPVASSLVMLRWPCRMPHDFDIIAHLIAIE